MTACGPFGCCDTGHLDNEANNWQRGKVDTFRDSEIGDCDSFDVGDSTLEDVNITLRHTGWLVHPCIEMTI